MNRLFGRLARASAAELRFRAREKACQAAEAVRFATGGNRWRRETLRSGLLPASSDLQAAAAALKRDDWREAGAAIRAHFVRRHPRFVIDPGQRDALAAAVRGKFPGSGEDARHRAERLMAGRYDLLGYQDLSFATASGIDWHADPVSKRSAPIAFWARVPYLDARVGDHKVIWELNRHQHWLALGRAAWLRGEPRYVAAIARQLESWMDQNPPLTGINWSSMLELAFRSISWIWALHLCAPFEEDDSAWYVDLLVGLDRQLDHVARHLSVYFSPNTHLLGEALGLYIAGRVLPEMRSAARWEDVGRRILIREARAQVHPDGGHAERSTHYHRYALDFYLLALAVARKTTDPAASEFEEVAARLATFCRALATDDGRLPTIGDDDGGLLFPMCGRSAADVRDSLALAAALLRRPELAVGPPPEEVLWMLGGDVAGGATDRAPAPATQFFPDTGYAVIRSTDGHAVFDAGRHGFLNGGHAHADALAIALSVGGRALLIDPGTATYTVDPERRDRFRSTAMHNTVVVDGRSQSMPAGPFHWSSTADAQIVLWRSGGAVDYVEAEHDGFKPIVHRRAVVRTHAGNDDMWLIADHLLGSGRHRAEVYWHLDPDWSQQEPDGRGFTHPDGLHAAIASTAGHRRQVRGDKDGVGWCAPVYGRLVAATALCDAESAEAPFSIVTAIAAATRPLQLSARAAEVATARQDGWHRAAALVECNDLRVLTVMATPLASAHRESIGRRQSAHRAGFPDGELTTDARLAVLQLSGSGEPLSLSLIECTEAAWTGRGAFAVPASREAGDLHLGAPSLRQLRSNTGVRLVG